jgi:hypothetical protein
MITKIFQCIGRDEDGTQCQNALTIQRDENAPDAAGPYAPYPEHPTWSYICPRCANAAPRKGSRNSQGIVLERPVSA